MKLDQVYNFFIHPFSEDYSTPTKILSTITILACSILTSGVFFVVFGVLNLRDSWITQKKESSKKMDSVATVLMQPDEAKINLIKNKHNEQLKRFEEWAAQNDWKMFSPQYSHYDWWMFPIMRESQHGTKYSVTQKEIEALKKDNEFMQKYRRGVELVVRSWGWELKEEVPVQKPIQEQAWTGYDVRLGKMADSLYLFGEKELYNKLQKFYQSVCLSQIQKYPLEKWVSDNLSRTF